jgi:hypothetical protein
MAQYLVKAPCAYVNSDGAAVQHHDTAVDNTVVELDAQTAAELGSAVQPLLSGAAPDTVKATPFPDGESPRRRPSHVEDKKDG